ncbi:HD domain-containing protein [Nocardia transvalensis]|uniref:HD domain-containing protein n=1 Tax=Nocardia transvalensis TaxID=37333 RepID=UPI001895AF02|nr:HD domain-containing protein [Nocardia transvalensis]MBF6327919.1 HD domain-containing protein [Nocardia transvalensis]
MSPDLPDTPLARAAGALIDSELDAPLRNHSLRSFLFARALADSQGLHAGADYDEEVMFLICALHDIGLADAADGDQRFEVDGADYAAEFLESQGITDERVDIVWDAIAAHTTGLSSSPVYRRRRPAAIWIAVDGIGIDIGGSAQMLPGGYADRVHAAYPRLGGIRALTRRVEEQAVANPRKALPGSLTGEVVRLSHPELVPTWADIIAASGWND